MAPHPNAVDPGPRLFQLKTGDRVRCRNLIIHPNGRLYGDVTGLACSTWGPERGRIYFIDRRDRVRFMFEPGEQGVWKYTSTAAQRGQMVRGTIQLENRGTRALAMPSADYLLLPQFLPMEKDRWEIVVAKFKEDVTWSETFPRNVTIYSKDPADRGKYTILPNLGREGGTYLHHIVTHYDRLAERTLFLQGDPFPHSMLAFDQYASSSVGFAAGRLEESDIHDAIPWSSPLQRIDQAVMEDFLRLAECHASMIRYTWVQGAQFAVTREQIRRRSLDYYRKMHALTQQGKVRLAGRDFDNHHVAWIFELFWRHIFAAAAD